MPGRGAALGHNFLLPPGDRRSALSLSPSAADYTAPAAAGGGEAADSLRLVWVTGSGPRGQRCGTQGLRVRDPEVTGSRPSGHRSGTQGSPCGSPVPCGAGTTPSPRCLVVPQRALGKGTPFEAGLGKAQAAGPAGQRAPSYPGSPGWERAGRRAVPTGLLPPWAENSRVPVKCRAMRAQIFHHR